MAKKKPATPAVPAIPPKEKKPKAEGHLPETNMTIRDRFAMAAMQGRLANGSRCDPRQCYSVADEMIEARKNCD